MFPFFIWKGGDYIYIIPPNFEGDSVTASGISMRNLIEGVVFFVASVLIFAFLPIPLKIRIVLIVIVGGAAGIFGVIGIEHMPVTKYIKLCLKFKKQNKKITKKEMFERGNENEN